MTVYNIGLLVKDLRLQHGLTQAELAEGICSRDTVVKIENGKRKPDYYVLNNILERLGAEELLEYANAVPDTKLFEAMARTDELFHQKKYDEIEKLLKQIESNEEFSSTLSKRNILFFKIAYRTRPGLTQKQYQEAIEMSFEALKINRPNFDIKNLETYYLSPQEFRSLSQLGFIYNLKGDYCKSAALYQKLINNYDKKYRIKLRPTNWYISFFSNCGLALLSAKHYEKALEIVEKGLKLLLFSSAMQYYSMLHTKAICLCRLKRTNEGKETFKKLCYLLIATDKNAVADFKSIAQEFEKDFGLVFEDAVIKVL